MNKKQVRTIGSVLQLVIGILMIVLGVNMAGKFTLNPPIVSGVGFIVIAWVLWSSK